MKTAPTQSEIRERRVRRACKKLLEYIVKPTDGRKREYRRRIKQAVETPHGYRVAPGDLNELATDQFLERITANDVPTWHRFLESIRDLPEYMDFRDISPLAA